MANRITQIISFIFIGLVFIQLSCAVEKTKEEVKRRKMKYDIEIENVENFNIGSYQFEVYKTIVTYKESGKVEIELDTSLINLDDFCNDYCDELFEQERREYEESNYEPNYY